MVIHLDAMNCIFFLFFFVFTVTMRLSLFLLNEHDDDEHFHCLLLLQTVFGLAQYYWIRFANLLRSINFWKLSLLVNLKWWKYMYVCMYVCMYVVYWCYINSRRHEELHLEANCNDQSNLNMFYLFWHFSHWTHSNTIWAYATSAMIVFT